MSNQEIKEFCKFMKVDFESLIGNTLTTRHKRPIKAAGEFNGKGEIKNFKMKTVYYKTVTLKWRTGEGTPYLIN